ncbi:MIH1 [Candida pseudojiufengensis]|uniref:MIH1 n=1 Tax=Candida pseudojiufengensis TaxID=497109 RepID=UPI0022255068|nr:MIH1 [Candida pseudojiufengensis]KAI5959062.1 MIH1 [Candida pseudojiufengensis]
MNQNEDKKFTSKNTDSSTLNPTRQYNFTNDLNLNKIESQRTKRNRPLSSYMDETFESTDYFTINDKYNYPTTFKSDNVVKDSKNNSQLKKKSSFASLTSPIFQKSKNLSSSSSKISDSPLSSRKPLKSLTNLHSSIKAISKASHSFFNSFHMTAINPDTSKDEVEETGKQSQENEEVEEVVTDCDSDEDDTFDTIQLGSPTENLRNRSQRNSISISNNINNSPSKMVEKPFPSSTSSIKLINKPNFRRYHSVSTTQKELEDCKIIDYNNDNTNLKNSTIKYHKSLNNSDTLLRINETQLEKILKGEHNHEFNKFLIVDCRFQYEYNGGHINSAININSYDDLENKIQKLMNEDEDSPTTLLIFHCEFSVYRSILMAKEWRRYDRLINKNNYPYLTWPDIVILEGGYKGFFEKFPNFCYPKNYIPMNQNNDSKNLINNIRNENKLLNRAKSFNQFNSSISNNSVNEVWNNDNEYHQQHNKSSSFSNLYYSNNNNSNKKTIKRQKSNSKVNLNLRLTRANTFSSNTNHQSLKLFDNNSTIFYTAPNYNQQSNSSSPASSPTLQHFQFNDDSTPPITSTNTNTNSTTSSTTLQRPNFLPPSTSYRNNNSLYSQYHRKSYSSNFSSSSLSINSTLSRSSSINSENNSLLNFDTPNSPFIDSTSNHSHNNHNHNNHNHNHNQNLYQSPSLIHDNSASSTSTSNSSITDYFDSKKPSISSSITTTTLNDQSPNKFQSPTSKNFQFPKRSISTSKINLIKQQQPSLSKTKDSSTLSPKISSPLSTIDLNINTPKSNDLEEDNSLTLSTIQSNINNSHSSIYDPINDTPVEFSIPTTSFGGDRNVRKSKSISNLKRNNNNNNNNFEIFNHSHTFSIPNGIGFNSVCDINEVDEEEN